MRVLVMGGTEFVSLHLVRALLRDGHHVVVLNRGRRPERLPTGVGTLLCDRKDHAALRATLAGERVDANHALRSTSVAPSTSTRVPRSSVWLAGSKRATSRVPARSILSVRGSPTLSSPRRAMIR